MSETNFVTIIRRRVVYEELIVTSEEFDTINKTSGEGFLEVLNKFEDGNFDPNFMDEDSYIAFRGDVTDRSDDYVYCLPRRTRWSKGSPIRLASAPYPYL